jgi:hypothetical protein
MRYLSSISLALIVLMALACTATPATPAPTPLPTPDVPLLDEETVSGLVQAHVIGQSHICGELIKKFMELNQTLQIETRYVGRDIWVVNMGVGVPICTFTVHDKEAHVILPQQDKTTD